MRKNIYYSLQLTAYSLICRQRHGLKKPPFRFLTSILSQIEYDKLSRNNSKFVEHGLQGLQGASSDQFVNVQ